MLRTLAIAAMLVSGASGCSRPVPTAEPAGTVVPWRVDLAPGERTALPNGGTLRYVALVSDSRCPSGVQCIHAGEAVLRFELEATGRTQSFVLSTAAPRDAMTAGAYRIGLLDVSRPLPPQATLSISPAE